MRNFFPISDKRSLALLASKFEGFLELLAIRKKNPIVKKSLKILREHPSLKTA